MLGVIAAGSVAPAEAFAADNLPPVNTVPADLSVNEDNNLTLSGSNAISVSDPDAGVAVIDVTLTATHGTLTLGGTTGLTFATDAERQPDRGGERPDLHAHCGRPVPLQPSGVELRRDEHR